MTSVQHDAMPEEAYAGYDAGDPWLADPAEWWDLEPSSAELAEIEREYGDDCRD